MDIPAPRPRPTPGILSVPAVKDTVYRRLPVNGFSSALSLLNGQKSANTNPTKTRSSVRDVGQKRLDAYINVGAPQQQQKPVAAAVAVNRRGVLPVKESVPAPVSSPASASLSPVRGEKRVQLAPRFDSSQRNIGSIKQLETPRSTATSAVPVPVPNTPKPVRVKQEPQSNSRQSLPQTPARTRTSKINNSAIRKTRALTSSGTFRDPYSISSDSDTDSDNEPPNPRSFQSFAELDNAVEASSPWTENFREREVSVEAVLAEVPTWLDFSSPIPYPIPINSGSTPGHGRQDKRPRNDVGEEKEKNLLSVSSKDLPSSPLIKTQTATSDKSIPIPIPIETSSGSGVSSGSSHVVTDTRQTNTKRPRNDVSSKDRHLSRHIPSSPPSVKPTATPGSRIVAEISSGFAPSHVVANARQRQNKRPWNDVDEDKRLTGDLPSSPPPAAAKKRTVTSNSPIPISSSSSHAVADARQRQNKRPRSDVVVKDEPPSSVSRELPSSSPTKEPSDKCTDHDDRVKKHNTTRLSGVKENKAASRHRNRDRKAWWAKRKLRKQRKVSGGS